MHIWPVKNFNLLYFVSDVLCSLSLLPDTLTDVSEIITRANEGVCKTVLYELFQNANTW